MLEMRLSDFTHSLFEKVNKKRNLLNTKRLLSFIMTSSYEIRAKRFLKGFWICFRRGVYIH